MDVCTHKKCVKDGEGGLMVNVTVTNCPKCLPWEIAKSHKPHKCCDTCETLGNLTTTLPPSTTSYFTRTTWNGTTVIIVTPSTVGCKSLLCGGSGGGGDSCGVNFVSMGM